MEISRNIHCEFYTQASEPRSEVLLAGYLHQVDSFAVVGLQQDSIAVKFNAYVKTIPGVVHTLMVCIGRTRFVVGVTEVNGVQQPFTPSATTDAHVALMDVYCGLVQPKNLQTILEQNAPMFYARYKLHLDNFFEVTK